MDKRTIFGFYCRGRVAVTVPKEDEAVTDRDDIPLLSSREPPGSLEALFVRTFKASIRRGTNLILRSLRSPVRNIKC